MAGFSFPLKAFVLMLVRRCCRSIRTFAMYTFVTTGMVTMMYLGTLSLEPQFKFGSLEIQPVRLFHPPVYKLYADSQIAPQYQAMITNKPKTGEELMISGRHKDRVSSARKLYKPVEGKRQNTTLQVRMRERPAIQPENRIIAKDKADKEVNKIKPEVKAIGKRKGKPNPPGRVRRNATELGPREGRKLILLWTPLTKDKPLWGMTDWSFHKCKYKNCDVTNDRTVISQADTVLFRVRALKQLENSRIREFLLRYDLNDLPKQKYQNQTWVDVNQESPMYSHSDEELKDLDGKMDYIVSYHSQSDYTYSYMLGHRKRKNALQPRDYSQNKTKMALWYVSHCDALSGRQQYVQELIKHNITIDIFGKCSGLRDGCKGANDRSCIQRVRSQYRFYLAFENSICSEYITEKYWNTLNSDAYNIPIALGASLQEYEKYSPPNSYLHTRNFSSPGELANYMRELSEDRVKFNSYHAWREQYQMFTPEAEHHSCWYCRVANERPAKNHGRHSEYWSRKKFCEQQKEPIQSG